VVAADFSSVLTTARSGARSGLWKCLGSFEALDSMALVKLFAYILAWYYFTVTYNITHKSVVHDFPLPLTIAAAQLVAGIPVLLPVWQVKMPKVNVKGWWRKYGVMSVAHMLATMLSALSMHMDRKHMTVHYVSKALEPLYALTISMYYRDVKLAQVPRSLLAALFVIVVGMVVACPVSVEPGTWATFVLSSVGVLLGQTMTVLAKELMPAHTDDATDTATATDTDTATGGGGSLYVSAHASSSSSYSTDDDVELLSVSNILRVVTLFAAAQAVPVAIMFESHKWGGVWRSLTNPGAEGEFEGVVDPQMIVVNLLVSGVAYFFMHQMAFLVLDALSPTSLAVAWVIRRVTLVGAWMLFTKKHSLPVPTVVGTCVSAGGCIAYVALAMKRNRGLDFSQ
jgi:hypothetical protein